jgi:hypothetical protein
MLYYMVYYLSNLRLFGFLSKLKITMHPEVGETKRDFFFLHAAHDALQFMAAGILHCFKMISRLCGCSATLISIYMDVIWNIVPFNFRPVIITTRVKKEVRVCMPGPATALYPKCVINILSWCDTMRQLVASYAFFFDVKCMMGTWKQIFRPQFLLSRSLETAQHWGSVRLRPEALKNLGPSEGPKLGWGPDCRLIRQVGRLSQLPSTILHLRRHRSTSLETDPPGFFFDISSGWSRGVIVYIMIFSRSNFFFKWPKKKRFKLVLNPELNLYKLNLKCGSGFGEMPEPNLRLSSEFGFFGKKPHLTKPRQH